MLENYKKTRVERSKTDAHRHCREGELSDGFEQNADKETEELEDKGTGEHKEARSLKSQRRDFKAGIQEGNTGKDFEDEESEGSEEGDLKAVRRIRRRGEGRRIQG